MSWQKFWQTDEDQFQKKVRAGQMVKRVDGTYVDRASFGFQPGYNSQVQSGALPAVNTSREYGAEVAESFFRRDGVVETVAVGNGWKN